MNVHLEVCEEMKLDLCKKFCQINGCKDVDDVACHNVNISLQEVGLIESSCLKNANLLNTALGHQSQGSTIEP